MLKNGMEYFNYILKLTYIVLMEMHNTHTAACIWSRLRKIAGKKLINFCICTLMIQCGTRHSYAF